MRAIGLSWAVAFRHPALPVVFRDHPQGGLIKYRGLWDPPEAELDLLETTVNWRNSTQIKDGKGWEGSPAVGVHKSTQR